MAAPQIPAWMGDQADGRTAGWISRRSGRLCGRSRRLSRRSRRRLPGRSRRLSRRSGWRRPGRSSLAIAAARAAASRAVNLVVSAAVRAAASRAVDSQGGGMQGGGMQGGGYRGGQLAAASAACRVPVPGSHWEPADAEQPAAATSEMETAKSLLSRPTVGWCRRGVGGEDLLCSAPRWLLPLAASTFVRRGCHWLLVSQCPNTGRQAARGTHRIHP